VFRPQWNGAGTVRQPCRRLIFCSPVPYELKAISSSGHGCHLAIPSPLSVDLPASKWHEGGRSSGVSSTKRQPGGDDDLGSAVNAGPTCWNATDAINGRSVLEDGRGSEVLGAIVRGQDLEAVASAFVREKKPWPRRILQAAFSKLYRRQAARSTTWVMISCVIRPNQ
jgi:hypothetical protein